MDIENNIELSYTKEDKLYNEIGALNNKLVNMQRELSKKNAELEDVNKLKNLFLGMVAHDLRNPICTILSYSQLLQNGMTETNHGSQIEFLNIIKSTSEFMLNLADELLEISEIEAGKLVLNMGNTDIYELTEKNIMINRTLAKRKNIEIEFYAEKDIPNIAIDASKITQVLNNLIGNAIKFSDKGSVIDVELYTESKAIVIAVIDKGAGIDDAEMDNLFKPFGKTSTKSTSGESNTGLGLYIAKKIVEGHGGKISVKSKIGLGTSFYIHLPYHNYNSSNAGNYLSNNEKPVIISNNSLNVLVVDDSMVNSKAIELILKELGHNVEKAYNGEVAIKIINTTAIDLVFMDIELPGINGLTTCKLIRELDKKKKSTTYIVGLSAHTEEVYKEKCIAAGMDKYARKPITKDLLSSIINDFKIIGSEANIEKVGFVEKKSNDDFNHLLTLTFFSEYPKLRTELERGMAETDIVTIRRICHKLKSSLSYIGAVEGSELAKQAEISKSFEDVKELAHRLIKEIDLFWTSVEIAK